MASNTSGPNSHVRRAQPRRQARPWTMAVARRRMTFVSNQREPAIEAFVAQRLGGPAAACPAPMMTIVLVGKVAVAPCSRSEFMLCFLWFVTQVFRRGRGKPYRPRSGPDRYGCSRSAGRTSQCRCGCRTCPDGAGTRFMSLEKAFAQTRVAMRADVVGCLDVITPSCGTLNRRCLDPGFSHEMLLLDGVDQRVGNHLAIENAEA